MGNVQQYIGKRVVIGRYEVEVVRYLGEGGSSFIFLVKDATVANPRLMVLKRLLASNDVTYTWIQSEIRIHQQLQHSNIVEYFASHTNKVRGSEREVFILMEYCPSGHLYENMMKMGEKRFTERELIYTFKTLCIPVAFLHRQNPPIAHRDLKLENFLMAKNGVYKLCDFGSCVEGPQSLQTREDRLREVENVDKRTTAMYRSPELADVEGTAMFGAGVLTEAVDVWAMGCILYTMAFFKQPFPPEGLRTERYTIPATSKYSADVHTLITRMLTADVEKRATIDHVLDCLDEMLENRPIPKLPSSNNASSSPKKAAKTAATASSSTSKTASGQAAAGSKKTEEKRHETLPISTNTKPAMNLLDMDFNPTISTHSSKPEATTSSGSTGWSSTPTSGFADFANFPSPTAFGTSQPATTPEVTAPAGKRLDEFGFPVSPVKQQQQQPPAFGFNAPPQPAPVQPTMMAAHPPATPVDPFEGLSAGGPIPNMYGNTGMTQSYLHGQQPQHLHQPGFFQPPQQGFQQQYQQHTQGFQPQYQQQQMQQQQQPMWGHAGGQAGFGGTSRPHNPF